MWKTAIYNNDDSDITKGQYRTYTCCDCGESFDVELDNDGNEVDYRVLDMIDNHTCYIDDVEVE